MFCPEYVFNMFLDFHVLYYYGNHMFNDFENNLREMGFGDIAVNKKMKLFIRAFYGRLAQYSKGIDSFYLLLFIYYRNFL